MLAAVVLVSGLATSSLTQAAISIESPPERVSKEAVAQRAITDFSLFFSPEGGVRRQLTQPLAQITYSTILMGEKDRRALLQSQIEPTCPVGNCRWERFHSLGICTSTRNLTDELTVEPLDIEENDMGRIREVAGVVDYSAKVYNITLGANTSRPFSVYGQVDEGRLFAADWGAMHRLEPSDDEQELRQAVLARQDIVYKPLSWRSPDVCKDRLVAAERPWRAMQWVFHWCVYEYEVSVAAGVPRTEVIDTTVNFKPSENNMSFIITGADETEEFVFDSTKLWLQQLKKGSRIKDHNFLVKAMEDQAFSETIDSDMELARYTCEWDKLGDLADDIALAMTNA